MSWRLFFGEIKQRRFFRVPSSYVFTPNREEVINSRLRLRYSTTCDTYYRDWSDSISLTSNNVMPGWERGIYALDSVYRNVDEDSGEVYFDRIKDNTTGNLKWKFDFSSCGLLVDEITVCLNYLEEYGGEITTTIVGNAGKKRIKYLKGGEYMTFNQLQNSSEITVVVHFIGDSHQVTKLFPQKIMGAIGYPMDILISLKPPLESLGKPRILLGLMYSNAQEIQVDARHYKETGKPEAGRGFLHVDFYEAKDLPQPKGKTLESVAKCYLMPNCKKSKCKSSSRKGNNPFWNEKFLIVGVSFLEIKKQALEICFVNNQKKKNKFFGGLRLSLGYSKIMAAQAEKASQVISQLFSKPLNKDGDDKTSKDSKSNGTARLAIAVEKKEKGPLHFAQVNGSGPSKETEEPVSSKTPAINPNVDIKKPWNLTSTQELHHLDAMNTRDGKDEKELLSHSDCEIKPKGNGFLDAGGSSSLQSRSMQVGSKDSMSTAVSILQPGYTAYYRENPLDGQPWTKQKDQNSPSCVCTDKRTRKKAENDPEESRIVTNNKSEEIRNGSYKEKDLDANGNKENKSFLHRNGNVEQSTSNASENQTKTSGAEDIRNLKTENEQDVNTSSSCDSSKASDSDSTSTSCSAVLAQRWNRAASDRQLQKEQKRDAKKSQLERALGDGLESMMLDAVGLEIKQWENMIKKPKQWHYCWQILRKDMVPLHHCST